MNTIVLRIGYITNTRFYLEKPIVPVDKWTGIRYKIFYTQRRTRCEHCGVATATQLHHAIIRRDKRYPELDCEENLMPVCDGCHMSGKVDTQEVRIAFWRAQEKRGYDMVNWYKNLPFKTKENLRYFTE